MRHRMTSLGHSVCNAIFFNKEIIILHDDTGHCVGRHRIDCCHRNNIFRSGYNVTIVYMNTALYGLAIGHKSLLN